MPRRFVIASLFAFLVAGSTTALAQSDDFDDGNDDGWTRYDPLASAGAPPATFSFPGGGYRIELPASPNPAAFGPARAGSVRLDTTYTDFFVSVDVIDWNDSLGQAFGLVGRISELGLGTTDGYGFFYIPSSGAAAINLLSNEVPFAPAEFGDADIVLDPGTDYRMTFSGVGDTLVGRIYDLSDLNTPLATTTAVDPTWGSGHSGLVVSAAAAFPDAAGDVTFDNYHAAVPEPSSVLLAALGIAALAGRRFLRRDSKSAGAGARR